MNINPYIQEIISSSFEVHNTLGTGFLEAVYHHAFAEEIKSRGLNVVIGKPLNVFYKGICVGNYKADIVVENKIIIECKCVKSIIMPHIIQVKNYLKATGLNCGFIFNFLNHKVEFHRIFPPK